MKRIAVAAMLLVIVVVVGWVLLQREERELRDQQRAARLLDFDQFAVTAVLITFEQNEWRYEKRPEGWRLVSPVDDLADGAALHELLERSCDTPVIDLIEEPDDLAGYGLDPPRGVIRVEGVETPSLHVGGFAPADDGLYLRVEGGSAVLVVNRYEARRLTQLSPDRYRDRSLTGVSRSEILSLGIRAAASSVKIEREGDTWWVTDPIHVPASKPAVERLLSALEVSEISGFLDGQEIGDERFGLGRDAVEITIGTRGLTRVLLFGEPRDGVRFASRDDRSPLLAVAQEALDSIPLGMEALATSKLTNVNRYRVTRFSYRGGGGSLAAAREGEGAWRTVDGVELGDGAAYGLLARILEARLDGWLDGEVEGEVPLTTFEFELEDKTRDRIAFYSGNRVSLDSIPNVTLRLAAPPPPIPDD